MRTPRKDLEFFSLKIVFISVCCIGRLKVSNASASHDLHLAGQATDVLIQDKATIHANFFTIRLKNEGKEKDDSRFISDDDVVTVMMML